MAVDFESKKEIEKGILEQNITAHCINAICMESFVLTKAEYKRILQEEGVIKCPICGHRSL
jgi:DNA-directed RNA polymerase subunit RPC12/RpoP